MTPAETVFWITLVFSGMCFAFGLLAFLCDTIEALIRRVQS